MRHTALSLALAVLVLPACSLEPCTGDDFSCGSEGRWTLVAVEGIDAARPPDPRTDLGGSLDLDDGQGGYADLPLGVFVETEGGPEEQRARGVVAGRYSPRDSEGDNGTWELTFGLGTSGEIVDVRGEVEVPFDGETFRYRVFSSEFDTPILRAGQTLVFRRQGRPD